MATELVAPVQCEIGENPIWHAGSETLFFLDIAGGRVYRHVPATRTTSIFCETRVTGAMVSQDDGTFLLLQDGRASVLSLDGSLRELRSGLCPGNERFNDAIVDPEGRVFTGAMGGNGRLLRFDLDGSCEEIMDGLGIPNGLGFTPDHRGMYFIDSEPGLIFHFDYDRRTGSLSNRRVFAKIPRQKGLPDGMAVDAAGNLWIAIWFGGCIQRYTPMGNLAEEVRLPVPQTSAVCFGGSQLDEMYITSAATGAADSMRPEEFDTSVERGGGVYRVKLSGVRGLPMFRSRVSF